MNTTTEYQLKEKKRKLYMPSIKKLNINIYDEMSEKLKVKKRDKDRLPSLLRSCICLSVSEGNVSINKKNGRHKSMCECLCFQLTGLIIITLAFLACLLLLVMYKALWYDQLGCPEGFVLQVPSIAQTHHPENICGLLYKTFLV